MTRILAAASAGGHWEQMMLFKDMLEQFEVQFATTHPDLPVRAGIKNATILHDCNRKDLIASFRCFIGAFKLVRRFRPDVVISTGAAPGFFCIIAGRFFGARTLWIDSVANAEKMSMCGSLSRYFSTRCITQWEHLAKNDRPGFVGSVL